MRYKDKVVIVTGGSKGIGEGCVRVFVANGSNVVFCARGEKDGENLEEEMNRKGPGESLFIKCDVSVESDIMGLIDTTIAKYGRLDCLINNAGWHPPFSRIDDISSTDFRNILELNVVNYFIFSKLCLPHLRKTKGNIINMSSLVGKIGQAGSCTYCATKGAITSFTKALAVDEAKHGVRVNVISPGNIWTPLWESSAEATANPEACIKGGEEAQVLGRMGTIEESGLACLYLAADATFCTGIDHILSGGAELNYGRKTQLEDKNDPYS